VVCFDGRLYPSGMISQASAGGRGRPISWESFRLATAPPITRPGMAAWRQPARRTATMLVTTSRG